MNRYSSISGAAKFLGVSISTLRRWEKEGKIVAERTPGGTRIYDLASLRPELFRVIKQENRKTIAYARVSSHDQKDEVILNKGVDSTFEEDLAKDVLEIITVFSARLYGSRSHKNQKLINGVKQAIEESSK